ncbi:hypothetical protein HHX47_DHR10000282 [Lentinula edodes]|nr:hypothetical protein HHX47_DHR10000282 [Lentinula edodes]
MLWMLRTFWIFTCASMGVVKLRVAICGGGIAGLAHACALARYPDVSVNIYESTDKFSPFGAGIGVWPRAWNVLCALGLGEDMAKITSGSPSSSPVQSFSFRKSDQPSGFTFGNMFSRGPLLTFHRAQFQEVLVQHLPPSCRIHHSKRLKSYSQGRLGYPIRLLFEDGTYATCDVLVGADGIKSAVRNCLLQDQTEIARESGQPTDEQKTLTCKDHVSWAGSIAYRALIPVERLKEDCDQGLLTLPMTPTMYVGTDVHMVVYPVSKGKEVNLALFHFRPELQGMPFHGPWSRGVEESELFEIAQFESWEPEVQRWLKDAYFLAELLGDPRTTLNTVQQALKVYDKFRRPWTQDASAKAMANGRYFTLHYDGFDFVHADATAVVQKLHELSDVMIDEWKWCWTTTVEDSLKAALSQLQYA